MPVSVLPRGESLVSPPTLAACVLPTSDTRELLPKPVRLITRKAKSASHVSLRPSRPAVLQRSFSENVLLSGEVLNSVRTFFRGRFPGPPQVEGMNKPIFGRNEPAVEQIPPPYCAIVFFLVMSQSGPQCFCGIGQRSWHNTRFF
jgi:hypothetical protein